MIPHRVKIDLGIVFIATSLDTTPISVPPKNMKMPDVQNVLNSDTNHGCDLPRVVKGVQSTLLEKRSHNCNRTDSDMIMM